METVQITHYKCSICGCVYASEDSAELCESKPKIQDKGVKVGDVVRITAGEGAGALATVKLVFVADRDWARYAGQRYWHTVALIVDIGNGQGNRMLRFDEYECFGEATEASEKQDHQK